MEKRALSVEDLRKVGRWATATNNTTMLADGTYKFGVITLKTAEIVGADGVSAPVTYPIIEVEGHGTISMTKLLSNQVKGNTPTLAKNGKTFFFPQVPVNDLFTGDLATVACSLQNKNVTIKAVKAVQQTGFPEKGKPWESAEAAKKGAMLVNKDVYQITQVAEIATV